MNWGRVTTGFPCLSTASQASYVSHFQGKNELDGPLAWLNTSVLTFFYYPFEMDGSLICLIYLLYHTETVIRKQNAICTIMLLGWSSTMQSSTSTLIQVWLDSLGKELQKEVLKV